MTKDINKISKIIDDSSSNVFISCINAINTLNYRIEFEDSANGVITFWSFKWNMHHFKYQCNIIDEGDNCSLCTIQTIDYGVAFKGILTAWADSIGLFIHSKKDSIKLLDLI